MKIDFHSHVKLAKNSDFSMDNFRDIIKEAKEQGLTALTITEHFNTSNFLMIYDTLDEYYEYKSDYYDVEGLKIFTGMEVNIPGNYHILLIGNIVNIRKIRQGLNGYEEKDAFISLDKLFELCDSSDILIILAHPFRHDTLCTIKPELLERFNAFDLNGKDLFEYGIKEMTAKVMNLGERYDIPVITGSDSHQYLQLGSLMTIFDKECETISEIKNEIKAGRYEIFISPCLNIKVKAARIIKNFLKPQLEAQSANN